MKEMKVLSFQLCTGSITTVKLKSVCLFFFYNFYSVFVLNVSVCSVNVFNVCLCEMLSVV